MPSRHTLTGPKIKIVPMISLYKYNYLQITFHNSQLTIPKDN